MTDKQIGAASAAAEIACISAMRSKDVEAIILKHCPQDKAVGKLVEAVKKAVSAGRGGLTAETVEARRISIIELEAALAEYEELNK